MNGPADNTFNNEALPLNKNIELETKQDNVAEMMCFLLPHHMTETNTSHEHQVNLVQLKEEPLDIMNGDIEKDPLAIEETTLVKPENLKVENEMQINLVKLKEEPLDIMNGDIEKDPLAIEETNLVKTENFKVENEVVTIDKATISGSTKRCITCKRCVSNSVNDGIIKKNQATVSVHIVK
ncbi:uncharacterized protein LOC142321002 [Lycorma delicatula]|uniref:uncharacterized protein LOC142321002 n=1 Tax=Lycorma delicatula TaxID=130591 RepID=UPI003F519E03